METSSANDSPRQLPGAGRFSPPETGSVEMLKDLLNQKSRFIEFELSRGLTVCRKLCKSSANCLTPFCDFWERKLNALYIISTLKPALLLCSALTGGNKNMSPYSSRFPTGILFLDFSCSWEGLCWSPPGVSASQAAVRWEECARDQVQLYDPHLCSHGLRWKLLLFFNSDWSA